MAGDHRAGRRPRILCVADEYPWPVNTGYRIRFAAILDALQEVGDVHLFCTIGDRPELGSGAHAAEHGMTRIHVHARPRLGLSLGGLARWVLSDWPRAVALRNWGPPAAALATFRQGTYDVAWYSHGDVWLALGSGAAEPTVVDLDNLESQILLAHASIPPDQGSAPVERVRALVRRRADRIDSGRWARAERRAVEVAAAAIVCSDTDAARLDARAVVIPNGYDEQPPPAPADGPVLTMVGLLLYKPNLDGALWFAREVLPKVRDQVPGATLRLIGRGDDRAASLRELDGVAVLGQVADTGAAMAGTAVIVAPLRSGSGTRIKILEAFARRYPVASTTLGCEGLGAEPGVHLLVGDTADDLAEACVRLLADTSLRQSVADAGWRLWDDRYRWTAIRSEVQQLVLHAAR